MFRRIGMLLLLTALLAGCSSRTAASPDQDVSSIIEAYPELAGQPWTQEVVKRVVDGDTIETAKGDKVRLIGVNTPETVKPNSPVEAYGKEASNFTKSKLTGKTVYLFKDAGDKDNYGRLLRYLFIAGETVMYNETLLAEGYANTMTVPPNVMFQKRFLEVERQARANNKGLWGPSGSSGTNGSSEKPGGAFSAGCAQPKIKGNINADKEKIYHVPGGRYYEQTNPEALFCTEDEAKAAGYRKSKD